jgi:selenide,water dikinase
MTSTGIKLTEWTQCGGCAAKWGGAPLSQLLRDLDPMARDELLVGLAPFDDAAVLQLTPDVALVSTTDFFPPLVDDPADFGAIAAANACSDVFAMGGRVVLALNISAFPEDFPEEAIAAILRAAAEKVVEAGGSVAGGHTIRSAEPIFGLAVQGLVDPSRVWTKRGAQAGDRLVLSKPLGSGIVLAGGTPEEKTAAIGIMSLLNSRAAADLRRVAAVHAVTDVTGFGLAGHCWEMAERSGVSITLDSARLPLYDGALEAAKGGTRTGGDARNRAYLRDHYASSAPDHLDALAVDPQTSGGLLAAVLPHVAAELSGEGWWEVGEASPGPPGVSLV